MKRLLPCLIFALVLSGCGGDVTAQPEPLAASASSSVLAEQPASTPETPTAPARAPSVPTRLRLGDIDAKVVPLRTEGTTLTPPDDPRLLGWWGKRAGARHGTTLLVGHTVHDGGGTFDDLEHTSLGDRATVNGNRYEVASVEVISKKALAKRATALFAQTGTPKLVLVTCEDYNRTTGHYASNVVVTLTPTG